MQLYLSGGVYPLACPYACWRNLRGIPVHALGTEQGWRSVAQDKDAKEIQEVDDFATVAALESRQDVRRDAWVDYVAGLITESLNLGFGNNV